MVENGGYSVKDDEFKVGDDVNQIKLRWEHEITER